MFAPIRHQLPPAVDFVGPMPFPAFQSMFDSLVPHGIQSYWRADFFSELNDEAIARHLEHAARLPTLQSTMHIYPIDGAVHRVTRMTRRSAIAMLPAVTTEVVTLARERLVDGPS